MNYQDYSFLDKVLEKNDSNVESSSEEITNTEKVQKNQAIEDMTNEDFIILSKIQLFGLKT